SIGVIPGGVPLTDTTRAISITARSPETFERCPELLGKELRLFPGREMATPCRAVVIDQTWKGLFCAAFRCLITLVREGADGDRDLDPLRCKESELVFPIEPCRRHSGVGQPVERNVVEHIIARQAFFLSVKYACDQLVAFCVVIEHPRGEANWGILHAIERL